MCDMNAFLVGNGSQEMVMESVEIVEKDGDQVRLSNIFGEEKTVTAVFEAIRDNKIYLAKTEP